MPQTKRVICIQCHNACRLAATVEEDRLLAVEPDESFPGTRSSYPVTKGCRRRRAALEYVTHPARLSHPLKRAGARGENRWTAISWEQAFAEIGERLRDLIAKYGPETLATTSGTGRTHDEVRQRFLNLTGTPNHTGAGAICYGPMCAVGHLVFGWRVFPVVRDNTQCGYCAA